MTGLVINETLSVPRKLEQALEPSWLAQALTHIGGGEAICEVREVEIIKTVATKARFTVQFEGSDNTHAFCLKSILGVDNIAMAGGSTTVLEADFYGTIAPQTGVRVPACVAAIIDRQAPQGLIIMRDLIADGAHFCSAYEAFTADQAAASVEQLAKLHQGRDLLTRYAWITPRVASLAKAQYIPMDVLQDMMNGPRSEGLSAQVCDAERLVAAMRELAMRDAARPQFLVHGDSHAGNIYRMADGSTGLIDWQLLQSGGWALDLAYHLAAVLPVELAEMEERRLLGHYLGIMRGAGFAMPDDETAWTQYREAAIYGYYLWCITRRVDPPIINLFTGRLGRAVMRHESHRLLGVA